MSQRIQRSQRLSCLVENYDEHGLILFVESGNILRRLVDGRVQAMREYTGLRVAIRNTIRLPGRYLPGTSPSTSASQGDHKIILSSHIAFKLVKHNQSLKGIPWNETNMAWIENPVLRIIDCQYRLTALPCNN